MLNALADIPEPQESTTSNSSVLDDTAKLARLEEPWQSPVTYRGDGHDGYGSRHYG